MVKFFSLVLRRYLGSLLNNTICSELREGSTLGSYESIDLEPEPECPLDKHLEELWRCGGREVEGLGEIAVTDVDGL